MPDNGGRGSSVSVTGGGGTGGSTVDVNASPATGRSKGLVFFVTCLILGVVGVMVLMGGRYVRISSYPSTTVVPSTLRSSNLNLNLVMDASILSAEADSLGTQTLAKSATAEISPSGADDDDGKSAGAVPQDSADKMRQPAGSIGGQYQGLVDLPPQKGLLSVAAREVSHGIVRSSAHLSESGMSIAMGIERSGQHIGVGISSVGVGMSNVGAGITNAGNSLGLGMASIGTGLGLGMACIALAIYLSSKNK